MSLSPRKHVMTRVFPLPRRRVWELLSQTDHLNRLIGLFPIRTQAYRRHQDGFVQALTARVAGVVPMRWNEHPFEWVLDERYAVLREYNGGPLARFYGGIELKDAEIASDGAPATRVTLFAEFTPSSVLGVASIPLVGLSSMKRTMAYLEASVRRHVEGRGYLLPQVRREFAVNRPELDKLLADLGAGGIDKELADLLREHLLHAGDDEVTDMQPFRLADAWKRDREAVLRMFLHATRLGLTNLSWQLICPNCRVSQDAFSRLTELNPQFHCDFCGIDYEANFDRYVELCFSVHVALRQAHKQVFCVGGPMITPHIHTQLRLLPGQETSIRYPVGPGLLRLRTLRSNAIASFADVAAEVRRGVPPTAVYGADGAWERGNLYRPRPGERLVLVNRSAETVYVALEKADWGGDRVTAARVTSMREFRQWFSSEVLAPGRQVGVENVTLLFSDLLGSTSFYERVGDAPAYSTVRRHFDFLEEKIGRSRGTLVKTIGDAVMAVFETPEHAVQAALNIQRGVHAFNLGNPADTPLVIKIGLYQGPAIVVNSNHVLDYFGRTVNLAARAQGLSAGGDIIMGRECAQREGVRELLSGYGAEAAYFGKRLKGIDGEIQLARISLPGVNLTGKEA